jgi:hypothetical protein
VGRPASWPLHSYELTVAGHLDDHWAPWLGCVSLVRNEEGSTTLTLEGADQAELHGVLARVRDLGVVLLALRTLTAL